MPSINPSHGFQLTFNFAFHLAHHVPFDPSFRAGTCGFTVGLGTFGSATKSETEKTTVAKITKSATQGGHFVVTTRA